MYGDQYRRKKTLNSNLLYSVEKLNSYYILAVTKRLNNYIYRVALIPEGEK